MSFKKLASKEINELHLTFNAVARQILLASKSVTNYENQEQMSQAVLSYADAYKKFELFGPLNE
jgi:hypothetical protein